MTTEASDGLPATSLRHVLATLGEPLVRVLVAPRGLGVPVEDVPPDDRTLLPPGPRLSPTHPGHAKQNRATARVHSNEGVAVTTGASAGLPTASLRHVLVVAPQNLGAPVEAYPTTAQPSCRRATGSARRTVVTPSRIGPPHGSRRMKVRP
ncbi:hypothetical protein ACWEOE_19990 [Amycolatopsis sp. NPDC004368]